MAVAPTYATTFADGKPWHVPGDLKEAYYTGTVGGSDTYATGGFAFTPANVGLSKLVYVAPITFSTGHWGIWDSTNAKIKVFSAAGTELANASTALQNATFVVKATGK